MDTVVGHTQLTLNLTLQFNPGVNFTVNSTANLTGNSRVNLTVNFTGIFTVERSHFSLHTDRKISIVYGCHGKE